MKEKDLIDLRFEKNEDNDGVDEYYYYTLELGNDYLKFCLISNANDEVENDEWSVKIFDYDNFVFVDVKELKKLIKILKDNEK